MHDLISPGTFLVVALLTVVLLEDLFDHAWIGQRRNVAQLVWLIFGDLAQNATHNLAAASFGQVLGEQELVWHGIRGDL